MNAVMEKIYQVGFVPVVALHDASKAAGLAKALEKGGIPIIEVTYRTAEASQCIEAIRKECPNVAVGAGTVVTVEQVKEAVKCGAMYIVSPGYDDAVVDYCIQESIPVIPGVANASQIQKGVQSGLKVLKFFPSESSGGISAINFLAAPFPGIQFIPAGGILMNNLGDYLYNENVFACAGGFVARSQQIESEDWDTVTSLCQQAVRQSLGFEFDHVGINCEDAAAARQCADFLLDAFNQVPKEGNSSIFAEKGIEIMKTKFYGTNGHLGFSTNSVERAVFHMRQKGYEIIPETVRYNAKDLMQSAYLKQEVGGFATHLVRKKK